VSACVQIFVFISSLPACLYTRTRQRNTPRSCELDALRDVRLHCPGREPPFLAVKRPACPYKSGIHNPIYYGKYEGRLTAPGCPDTPPACPPAQRPRTWGGNSVSSGRSHSRAKGPGTSAGAFPIHPMTPSLSGEDPRGPQGGAKGSWGTPKDPLSQQPRA
jgi:hypothetical protein